MVRSVLHLKIIPNEFKKIIFQEIASRIPLLIVDQFSIKVFNRDKIVIGKPSMSSVANQLYWKGFSSREPETTKLFYKLAKRARTIIEVGSSIGFYSLLGSAANKKAEIFVFEPQPFIFGLLERNISLNNFSNITPIRKAISDVDGKTSFFINLDSDQSSSMLAGFRENVEEILVPSITLDTFVAKNSINQVDLVKIDVEGQDHRVLKGMERILTIYKPDIICEVLYGRVEEAIEEILPDFGYRYYWITDDGLILKDKIIGDNTYRSRNWLFTKKDYNEKMIRLIE